MSYKRMKLDELGGLHTWQESFAFMQDSYRNTFKQIAALLGNNVILNGVVLNAGQYSSGWIIYDGDLMPFVGGLAATNIHAEELAAPEAFDDGSVKDIYFTRRGIFSNVGGIPFADFKRATPIKDYWLAGDVKQVDCDAPYITANFDNTGLGIGERIGWAICNGNNGTKDRRGLFSVAYDDRNVDPSNNIWDILYNTIGGDGGAKNHTLTASELPALSVSIPRAGYAGIGGSGDKFVGTAASPASANQSVAVVGTLGQAHNNIPPFIVTLHIQKINL